MKKTFAKTVRVFLSVLICLVFTATVALAAEPVTVKIPVSCSGAACTAALFDSENNALEQLALSPGVVSSFTVTCSGIGDFHYSIKLSNEDTDLVTYDDTVFQVTVTTYYDGEDKLRYVITADPTGVLGEEGNSLGKPSELRFDNKLDDEPETVDITVTKTWVGPGPHPDSIRVDLLRGKKVLRTVTLDEDNGWKYVFRGLEKGYNYSVAEHDPPAGYTTSISWSGKTCRIVNTKDDVIFDDPPIRKIVTGRPSRDERFIFVLTPDDPSYPMPEGSKDGFKELTIIGQGVTEVGIIAFTKPGHYSYTLREKNTGAAGYFYDASVYVLSYEVTEKDGKLSSKRTVTKDGVEITGFTAAIFTNVYQGEPTDPGKPVDPNLPNKPHKPDTPRTGDFSRTGLWAASAAVSFLLLILSAVLWRRAKKDAKEKQ